MKEREAVIDFSKKFIKELNADKNNVTPIGQIADYMMEQKLAPWDVWFLWEIRNSEQTSESQAHFKFDNDNDLLLFVEMFQLYIKKSCYDVSKN